jgi:CRP/FNR family cyclic AMP-dependent transcriptional regulator
MEKPTKDMFDPKKFLARVGAGKTILEFHKNQHVFEQGDVADTFFTFRGARSSLLSCLSRARKRSSQF